MKAWQVKNFMVEEIDCVELNINNGNIFDGKEEAIRNALDRINERVLKNLIYLERLHQELTDQEKVIEYYLQKRNILIAKAKAENIKIYDVML